MRNILIGMLGLAVFACQPQSKQNTGQGNEEAAGETVAPVDSANAARFDFKEKQFDFGKVTEGEKVSHSYVFTNTGKSSLVISNAQASCGCTVPEWTREPVAPGKTGEIQVIFDSNGRAGKQHKTVTVYANTYPSVVQLELTGEIVDAEN